MRCCRSHEKVEGDSGRNVEFRVPGWPALFRPGFWDGGRGHPHDVSADQVLTDTDEEAEVEHELEDDEEEESEEEESGQATPPRGPTPSYPTPDPTPEHSRAPQPDHGFLQHLAPVSEWSGRVFASPIDVPPAQSWLPGRYLIDDKQFHMAQDGKWVSKFSLSPGDIAYLKFLGRPFPSASTHIRVK